MWRKTNQWHIDAGGISAEIVNCKARGLSLIWKQNNNKKKHNILEIIIFIFIAYSIQYLKVLILINPNKWYYSVFSVVQWSYETFPHFIAIIHWAKFLLQLFDLILVLCTLNNNAYQMAFLTVNLTNVCWASW